MLPTDLFVMLSGRIDKRVTRSASASYTSSDSSDELAFICSRLIAVRTTCTTEHIRHKGNISKRNRTLKQNKNLHANTRKDTRINMRRDQNLKNGNHQFSTITAHVISFKIQGLVRFNGLRTTIFLWLDLANAKHRKDISSRNIRPFWAESNFYVQRITDSATNTNL